LKIFDSISVKKLYDNLEYWKFIGIAKDIYECPDNRLEYKPYVDLAKRNGLYEDEIVKFTICGLENELCMPWYDRPTFWYLIKLTIKRAFRII